ncbi:MAG TPA: cyclopropane-fatty-acyl-phospholipid synthase family protein [Acidimicrobiales bacterium]|nr:cyclopropane-fatty-acyl-phospholipid synthase family protein [Acidimicrobiales bacterium]
MTLASLIESLLGSDTPVAIEGYDGSRIGPADARATIVLRSPDAVVRIVQNPGELGFARAYVTGELDVEGDMFEALSLRDLLPKIQLGPAQWLQAAQLAGRAVLHRLPTPPEEAHLRGRRHSRQRDRAAVSHHYDVSNEFYRLFLGPSMTYSCALWSSPKATLEDAQAAKYDLVCHKLDLRPGQRLLDVGCGWGGMVTHAAGHYGAEAVGVTLSARQVEWASKAIAEAGMASDVVVRLQDYRDIADGPYDAISSIGMFEHVGVARLREYFAHLYELVEPGGRVLNHGISRQPAPTSPARVRLPAPVQARISPHTSRDSFLDRYVFPDGELHEVGSVVSVMQEVGFEVRHVESLREHYALTLRAWVANLESHWDEAVETVGAGRARVWRLYMAASALNFEAGRTSIHQVLAVRPEDGRSGIPLRPRLG